MSAKRESRRGVVGGLILIAVTVVGLLLAAWFLRSFQRVERTLALPPHGEAGYNPLYALKRALQEDGVRVDSRMRMDLATHPLGERDTLLLLGDPRLIAPPEARRLLDWVNAGGHLIVRTPPRRTWERALDAPLLAQLRIVLKAHDAQCVALQLRDEKPSQEFCSGRRFSFDQVQPELSWGDLDAGYVYARLAHGKGRVDVLADTDFLENGRPGAAAAVDLGALFGHRSRGSGLREAAHQVLARQVLAPNYGRGVIHLVYAAQMPSLLRSVLSHGWPVWLPLLLAVLAWLWARAQRFGPLRPAPAPDRRSLLEHVHASGQHLFRYGKGALLHAAVRQAFLTRLQRRDPVSAALAGEAQVAALAQRLQVDPARLRQALQVPGSREPAAFRDRVSLLIQLRNRL